MDNSHRIGQNVFAMTRFQSETGYSAIAQVEAYWEAVRGTRLLPKRSDIDPRGIEQALEYAFILERIAPGIARLRIAGNHLNDLMGMEVRGMPLTSFFAAADRPAISDMLEDVFQMPAMSTLKLTSPAAGGRPKLDARMILLPLKSDLGDVSRALGCFVSKGDMGLSPRRFDIVTKTVLHITAGQPPARPSDPLRNPALLSISRRQDLPTGMAEDSKPFDGTSKKRRPPYLRLVKSED
ncbi:PAS domain-containing protein [Sulfitobacter sp. F26204]|uniref:PAS domain-containing protein n=1 Tax=Sulfitobacter sp. F26204 TaxID=2996014 RepID=UPI00225DD832|nr:PAS domain-containing protein [Sulfitobacter sp. F26204]MCX7559782.1 PAS domain-containing protein [Sulfitobacter sp. F26204]